MKIRIRLRGNPKTYPSAKGEHDTRHLMRIWTYVDNFRTLADDEVIRYSCLKYGSRGRFAEDVLKDLGIEDPILDIAKNLEQEALNDKYFVDRKLYPNVDFYSGIIYRALEIPTEMFTVMFALGRLPGWISQWREMRLNKEPIGRPRQIYNGNISRNINSKG